MAIVGSPLKLATSPAQSSPLPPVNSSESHTNSSCPGGKESRWYRPDGEREVASLRCIQVEEKAMEELRKIYGNVRVSGGR